MKWIKASERMPRDWQKVYIRYNVSKNIQGKDISFFDPKENAFMIRGVRYPPSHHFVEWLDETDWIEGKPEKDGHYLCATPKAGFGKLWKADAYIMEFENGKWDSEVLKKIGILIEPKYYMPLPEIPKT